MDENTKQKIQQEYLEMSAQDFKDGGLKKLAEKYAITLNQLLEFLDF